MDKGTITWYYIEKEGPPPIIESTLSDIGYTSEVCFFAQGKWVEQSRFVFHTDRRPCGVIGPASFNPTHWAYINYPE